MKNTVSQLIEQLSRFSPDARVTPDLDIQGVSPATECVIELENIISQAEEIERLEKELSEAEANLAKADVAIDKIGDLCRDEEFKSVDDMAKQIIKICDDAQD